MKSRIASPQLPGAAHGAELFVGHDMPERTLSELQVELFDRLRSTRLYSRLKNVEVERSEALACGWRAEVAGDFTVAEHNEASEIVRDLQRRFSLRTDPLMRSTPNPSAVAERV